MTTAGGLGETEVGGPAMNIVPKTGGNTFTAHFFGTGLNGGMQSDNFTQRLIDAGLRAPQPTNYLYDTSVSSGGPIIKDRLWFYSTGVLPRQRQRHLACSTTRTPATSPSGPTCRPTPNGRPLPRRATATARCSRTCA